MIRECLIDQVLYLCRILISDLNDRGAEKLVTLGRRGSTKDNQ